MSPRRIVHWTRRLGAASAVIARALPASTASHPTSDKGLEVVLFIEPQNADSWCAAVTFNLPGDWIREVLDYRTAG
jgi:hypothetical protein